ncbi:proline iminopeptidase [Xylariales sp. PMI_506]|nr:proline iminopeptidase [Xylariales sp. PMI_506]
MMEHPEGYEHADAFDQGNLSVDDVHTLYYEQYGKPDGKPVIFLHGGPGGNTSKGVTVFFNPAVYRVVMLDQRGAGKSTPRADITDNTTQHLVADIETLRSHLDIAKWAMVFGGSWGSTLALAYAEAHPEIVGSLVLRGVFLGSRPELIWADEGANTFFPELQENFLAHLTPEERASPELSYYRRLTSEDKPTRVAAAKAWNTREVRMSALNPGPEMLDKLEDEDWLMPHARLEAHYFVHDCFLEEDQLLKNADKIKHIPTSIVQGRLDLVCPPKSAWALHKALPQSKLYFISDAGHDAKEPGTLKKLVEVCDEYAEL